MLDFPLDPTGYKYRPLRRLPEVQYGWDVYALQKGFEGVLPGEAITADGYLGDETAELIWLYQSKKDKLVSDGIAGSATQRAICQDLIRDEQTADLTLKRGGLFGQLERESGFILGNQSPMRPNGSADCGVVQMNDDLHTHVNAFDSPGAIHALAERTSTYFVKYKGYEKVGQDRCWALAQGAWNAPAWTDTLAKGGTLGPAASAHIEAYVSAVTAYVRWN